MIDEKNDMIAELTQRVALLPEGDAPEIRGATDEEIAEIEADSGVHFPDVYRHFLQRMGRSAGAFLRGSDYSLAQRHRLRIRGAAERIIARSGSPWQLPDDAFVFLMHQGYQFLFFRCGEGVDPPVYLFTDADESPRCIAATLTEFFRNEIEDHERIVREYLVDEPEAKQVRAY